MTDAPSAIVIPFPGGARTSRVRKAAHALLTKTPNAKRACWLQALRAMSDTMTREGIAPDVIEREQWAFRRAVEAEMRQQAGTGSPPPLEHSQNEDGGAA